MKALIIDEPWISLILAQKKTWEMRSKPAAHRGRFGLIRKGSGAVVGVAELVTCHGPLAIDELRMHAERHRVPMEVFAAGSRWTTAWELKNARPLAHSVQYAHPFGAVTWVNLDPGVVVAIEGQVSDPPINPVSIPETHLEPPAHAAGAYSLNPSVIVPVAKDGSWFGPHLMRAGQFTIGEKGAEVRVDSFEEALSALQSMATPRWRRPNAQGNWGIVSGAQWARAGEVDQPPLE